MIYTTNMLLEQLNNYKNPQEKLGRLEKSGKYIKIIRGLYEDNPDTPNYLLANSIYSPSYISFEYALAYYGLIPEAVYNCTSATFGKRKTKIYSTSFGTYTYRDIPKSAFPFCLKIVNENGRLYTIATAEKAICDKLYSISPITNQNVLKEYLFEDLRIDKEMFNNLDLSTMLELTKKYKNRSCRTLALIIRGVINEQSNTRNVKTI